VLDSNAPTRTPPSHPDFTGCQTKRAHLLEVSNQDRSANPAHFRKACRDQGNRIGDRHPVRQFRHAYPGFCRNVTGKNDADRNLSEMAHDIVTFAGLTHSDEWDERGGNEQPCDKSLLRRTSGYRFIQWFTSDVLAGYVR
jgi:hypothetical protein